MTRNALLAGGDGRRLLAAQLCDSLASGLCAVALPWLVLDSGGGSGVAGLVFAATNLPFVVFGLSAGVTADRRSRRRVMASGHLLQASCACIVPLWALTAPVPAWLALASAFGVGTGRAYADAAAFGAVAELVGTAAFVEGQAALSTAWSIGLVLGPLAGGALIALVGAAQAITLAGAVFAAATVLAVSIRRPLVPPPAPQRISTGAAMREGIDVLLHTPILRLLTLVAVAWWLVFAGAEALIVPFLRGPLALTSHQAGWVLGAGAGVGVLTGPLVGLAVGRVGGIRLVALAIALSGAATTLFALSDGFWSALASWAIVSLASWLAITSLIGERQRHASPRLQARVGMTGRVVTIAAMTLGTVVASWLSAAIGLRELYLLFGIGGLAVATVAVPLLLRAPGARRAGASGGGAGVELP